MWRWGGSISEALLVLGAVAKGEPSTALILFMTYAFHADRQRVERWPPALHERLSREAVAGGGLLGGLRVEPKLGTPVRGGLPQTIARRTADGWQISGRKMYATGSIGIQWYIVWAVTDENDPRVGDFLVPAGSPGTAIEPTWDHLGMRATVSHDIVFDECLIPAEHALDVRRPEDWAPSPHSADPTPWLWNALSMGTIYTHVALAARDWLRGHLQARIPDNLGASLASLPRFQERFGEIETLLQTNRILIETAAAQIDAGAPPSAVEGNSIKYITTGNAIRVIEISLELAGNPGLIRANPLQRHYRDVLCSRIHAPQNDMILVAAGRAGLGMG